MTHTTHSRNIRKVAKNDFEITVDGEVIGYAASMIEAIERADAHILALVELEARTVEAEPVAEVAPVAPSLSPVGLAGITRENVAKVVARAKEVAAEHTRWQTAITRAADELQKGNWMLANGVLKIKSKSRNRVYVVTADEPCSCEAAQNGGKPCWHKAAHRILIRAAAQPAA